MPPSPSVRTALRLTVKFIWLTFLIYCPAVFLVVITFGWAFPNFRTENIVYFGWQTWFEVSVLASWASALLTALRHLFRPRKMILPAIIFLAPVVMLVFGNWLQQAAFALYIWPESAFIKNHCAPVDFVQDGHKYRLGVCNLVVAPDGSDDFNWIYDTSGDIENFAHLSASDRKIFATTLRHYYNDDPNAGFEYADFTAERYEGNFYTITFDEAETEGFTATYGRPPKNPKSPYPPFF